MKTKTSKVSTSNTSKRQQRRVKNEFNFVMESGETYRPFTDPRRIRMNDEKRRSGDLSKARVRGVPDKYLNIMPTDKPKAILKHMSHELRRVGTTNANSKETTLGTNKCALDLPTDLVICPSSSFDCAVADGFPPSRKYKWDNNFGDEVSHTSVSRSSSSSSLVGGFTYISNPSAPDMLQEDINNNRCIEDSRETATLEGTYTSFLSSIIDPSITSYEDDLDSGTCKHSNTDISLTSRLHPPFTTNHRLYTDSLSKEISLPHDLLFPRISDDEGFYSSRFYELDHPWNNSLTSLGILTLV